MADAHHPDIAALPERLERRIEWYEATPLVGLADPDHHLLCDALAALRTLARPVEDEERELEEIMQRFRDDAGEWSEEHEDMRKALKTLLARLAREKTSAEQERDGANRVVAEAGLRLRGAEQEIARLREIVVEMDGELRLARAALGDRELADTLAHINYAIGDAERALAAAAGAEEPRSARPISEQTQAELKALDEAAGMGRHRLRGFLTGKAEEPR